MTLKLFYQLIKKSFSHAGIFVCFFFLLNSAKAQVPSTEGVEFWLTFSTNWVYNQVGYHLYTYVRVSSQRACTVTLRNPYTGYTAMCHLQGGDFQSLMVQHEMGLCTGNGTIENKGILVTSTDTISVYAASMATYSSGVTNVLPTPALGNEYLIQTYSGGFAGSNIVFVATQNNTILDITLSEAAGGYPAGTPFSITLNAGQSYQLISYSPTGDLSGTRVVSRDCKKFAVFAGCLMTFIPFSIAADYIVEQVWPITSWGKEFIVTSSFHRNRERVRVTANENNTQIYRDGILLTTLNAGGTYEFEITPFHPAVYINANNPIAVYLYLTGFQYGGPGDPAMVWISPLEQRIGKKITFPGFPSASVTTEPPIYQCLNIVSPTSSVPSMRLNGNNISAQFNIVPGNINYSYARMDIIPTIPQTLEGDSGFIAHVYGLGRTEAYAFSVGSRAANLKNKLYVNGVASVDISANQEYCMNDTIVFRSYVETDYDAILWEFGDGMTGTGDTVTHFYPTPGYYTVNMIIDRHTLNNNCGGYDTISTFVRILENEYSIYDTICAGVHYTENGLDLIGTHDTLVKIIYPNLWGCDSIINVYLHVPPIDIPVTDSVCIGDTYNENGFNIYANRLGLITDTLFLLSDFGCDSTVILYLNVSPLPTISLGNDRILCSESLFPIALDAGSGMASYVWSTGETSQTISVMQEGTYSVTVSSEENCTATDEITIEIHTVTVTINQDHENPCINSIVTLTANTDPSNPGDTFYWEYDGAISPYFIPTVSGTYTVLVSLDCGITISSTVEVEFKDCDIRIPNVYTPNGDGVNDVFEIEYDFDFFSFTISIYDRWGKLVFNSLQPDFQWDGKTSTGSECSDGVYYWIIGFSINSGIYKEMNGTVTRITSSN